MTHNLPAELIEQMRRWRRQLHAHPELAFKEHASAELVARELESVGLEVHRGLAGTGVVGTLRAGSGERAIGLRADLDALPMDEHNDFAHRSQHDGAMHACGHDGHTSMLLGAARQLAESADFSGTVHFIFQPAEEAEGGGRVMVEDGLFERFPVEAVYGLHNWPGLPLGEFAVNPGPMMASFDIFEIRLSGDGCHAAMPERGSDVLLAASQLVQALQSVVSREIAPTAGAVLSVTQIHGGDAWNVIPAEALIRGTTRCFSAEVQALMERRIDEIAQHIVSAHRCRAESDYQRRYPATINSAAEARLAAEAASAVVGESKVTFGHTPSMASEDFAFMLNARPGAYIWMGVDGETASQPLHNACYDFNDDALAIGTAYWMSLVRRLLG